MLLEEPVDEDRKGDGITGRWDEEDEVEKHDARMMSSKYLGSRQGKTDALGRVGAGDVLTSSGSRITTGRPSAAQADLRQRAPAAADAITASPDATTARLRAWPIRVTTTWSSHSFASARGSPGRMPIVVPPASLAPRAAAAITSPRPPVTTVAAALGEQPPDLLRAGLVLASAADHRDLTSATAR